MKSSNLFFIYLNEYFERLRLDLKSDRTITTYKTSITCFLRYLTEVKDFKIEKITFEIINDDLIREYLKYLMDGGYSISTRNTRFIAVKSYVSFCADKDITLVPLLLKTSKIKIKKVVPPVHNWLTKNQVELLLKQPSRNRTGIRDRFIMMFLFSTGARLSEALGVKLKDIHYKEDPYVLLNGKGNKPRIVPITTELVNNLKVYLHLFHPDNNQNSFLFYVKRDNCDHKMSQDNVQRIIRKYGKMAKSVDSSFPDNIHPHVLRHSYGAILYRERISKTEIAKLMGHESETTTERYVETDVDFIRESLKPVFEKGGLDMFGNLSEEKKSRLKGK